MRRRQFMNYRQKKQSSTQPRKFKRRSQNSSLLNLEARSHRGQVIQTMRIPAGTLVLTTGLLGLVSVVSILDPQTQITNWVNRFQAVFSEFRIILCRMKLVKLNDTSGQAVVFWDEAASTLAVPPTSVEASERAQHYIPLSVNSSQSSYDFKWKPRDVKDLIFYSTSTTTFNSPVGFKVFTNTANYGSSATPVQVLTLQVEYTLEFRGLS